MLARSFVSIALALLAGCDGDLARPTRPADGGPVLVNAEPGTEAAPLTDDRGPAPGADHGVKPTHDGAAPTDSKPAACPWGGHMPASSAAGLADSAHLGGGTADERAVAARMNQQRSGSPLRWDDCLADLARAHSQDMVKSGYFGHGSKASPSAFLIADRAAAASFSIAASEWLTEDILQGDLAYYLKGQAANAVDIWMGSPGHAAPILECKAVGVGIATTSFMGTTTIIVTADFLCDK
jgi:uncharacterized protein YkwD